MRWHSQCGPDATRAEHHHNAVPSSGVTKGGSRRTPRRRATGRCFNSQHAVRKAGRPSCLATASRGCGTAAVCGTRGGHLRVPCCPFGFAHAQSAIPSVPDALRCHPCRMPDTGPDRLLVVPSSPGQDGLASAGDHGPLMPHVNLMAPPDGHDDGTGRPPLRLSEPVITRSVDISLCFWKSSDRSLRNKLEAPQLMARSHAEALPSRIISLIICPATHGAASLGSM